MSAEEAFWETSMRIRFIVSLSHFIPLVFPHYLKVSSSLCLWDLDLRYRKLISPLRTSVPAEAANCSSPPMQLHIPPSPSSAPSLLSCSNGNRRHPDLTKKGTPSMPEQQGAQAETATFDVWRKQVAEAPSPLPLLSPSCCRRRRDTCSSKL